MNSKDYLLVGDKIKELLSHIDLDNDPEDFINGVILCIASVGKAFAEDNPRFDMERWTEYVTSDL